MAKQPPPAPVVESSPAPSEPVAPEPDRTAAPEVSPELVAARAEVDAVTRELAATREALVRSQDDAKLAMDEIEALEHKLADRTAAPEVSIAAPRPPRGRTIPLRAMQHFAAVIDGDRRDLAPGDTFEASEDEMSGLAPGVHFELDR